MEVLLLNKKTFLKFFLTTFCYAGFCFLNVNQNRQLKVFAEKEIFEETDLKTNMGEIQNDITKSRNCIILQNMFNAGFTEWVEGPSEEARSDLIRSTVVLDMTEEKINCQFFNLPRTPRPEDQREKLFAILIDSKEGPIDFQFLDKNLKCTLTSKSSSESLAIHIYMQNENEENFLLHEKNFLCKTKFLPFKDNLLYKKYYKDVVTRYKKSGTDDKTKFGSIWTKSTPNTYSFGKFRDSNLDFIGVMEFPNGEHKEMSYEDRVIPSCTFSTQEQEQQGEEYIMPSDENYFNFKIPEDVKEVNIKIYNFSTYKCETEYEKDYNYEGYHNIKLENLKD